MPTFSITYNGYSFTNVGGHTWFERKAKYESDLPQSPAFRALVTYSVKQTFLEPSFADNQARYAALQAALATTQATLTILDENGKAIFAGLATVQTDDLPAQWGQTLTEVNIAFLVVENVSVATTGNDATYAGGDGSTVTLPNVVSFKESIKADRYSPLVPNRRETQGTVTLTGKLHPDPALSVTQGLLALLAQKEEIESCIDSADGTLAFGGFSREVKIETAAADLPDGSTMLTWTVTASYLRFPAGDYVETQYSFDQKDDLEKKERLTNVKGSIRAYDETSARAKVTTLGEQFAVTGRVLLRQDVSAQRLSGQDSDGEDTFVELTFALDFRELLPGPASFTVTSTDRRDVRSGLIRTTYAGKAFAATSAEALAQARACGAGKYPIQTDATEGIETRDAEGEDTFVEVTFSYEYLRRGTWQYAEVTSVTDVQTVGNGTQTISGVAMAATLAAALTLARSFMLPASTAFLQVNRETQEDVYQTDFTEQPFDGSQGGDAATIHMKVEFSYSYFVPGPVSASIQFSTRTSEDFATRDVTTDVSGTCYALSALVSDSAIEGIWNGLLAVSGSRKVKKDKTVQNQQAGGKQIYTGTSFALTVAAPLSASGDDILEASMSIEITYSQQKTVMTPIPYGTPFVQTDLGLTPGSKTVTGSITSLNLSTAFTWARAKYISDGYPEPARETQHNAYYPMSGTLIRTYRVDFTYRSNYAMLTFPGS